MTADQPTFGIPDPGRASKAVEIAVQGAGVDTCPTPDKKQYRSQAEANRDQRERHSQRRGKQQRHYPYECPSGEHWHLTHHTPERQKAVFEDGHVGLSAMANSFEGHDVRHVFTDQPLWIGRDVCEAVGISKHRDALAQLDDDERASVVVDTPGGPQRMNAVTEAGIWSLPYVRNGEMVTPDPTIRIKPKGLQELHRRLGGGEQLALIAGVS